MKHSCFWMVLVAIGLAPFGQAAADEFDEAVAVLRAVSGEGQGNAVAGQALQHLAKGRADTLPGLLAAMDGANSFAANYLRGAVEVIAGNALANGGMLPVVELGEFLLNKSHDARPRALAFELIRRVDPEAAGQLVPGLLGDPSVDLRREAVARLLGQAEARAKVGNKPAAVLLYRQALDASRDLDQIEVAAAALRDLSREVNLTRHFGFLVDWQLAGPFHNKDRAGFAAAFGPEKNAALSASYDGLNGKVMWQPYSTDDEYGMVDFNKPYGDLKEVTGYAQTEFVSATDRPAQLRIGCKNAWKIWLNSELVFGRDEYHRGMRIDQYQLPVQLRKGRNTILVKACQNEQVEDWTVQWQFQLRVCDATGTAIHSANKKNLKVAAK
ncbi:MAG: hypothetical protein VX392_06225 [Verrucomicrobiota bacterium]|nr:hypothetical protein [Verrucomicrobiota bacterium]